MRGDKESGMRILSVTAQKPCSTGSGVYLTEVVKALAKEGHTQTVLAGIARGEQMDMPDGVKAGSVCLSPRGDWYILNRKDYHIRLWVCQMRCHISVQDTRI